MALDGEGIGRPIAEVDPEVVRLAWAQEGWGAFYNTCVSGVTPLMQGTYDLVKKNTLTIER